MFDGDEIVRGERPLRLFVSSVIRGMEPLREQVAEAARERNIEPWVFERTAAHSGGLENSYLEQIAECDFVVWLEAGFTTQPVEQEIRRAIASRRTRLLVFRLPHAVQDDVTRTLLADVQRVVKYVTVDTAGLLEAVRVSLDDELARAVRGPAPLERFVLPPSEALHGREQTIRQLQDMLQQGAFVGINGLGGVGKTALAVAVASSLTTAARVLFVPLRGLQDRPADPHELLGELLEAFGVPSEEIPAAAESRADAWRAVTARDRPVIILDDARDEKQIRPLIPGAGAPAIVTSRAMLTGLDAALWTLDVLDRPAAIEIIADGAGARRTGDEPGPSEELAALCGDLPLALRIVGQRLASRPSWTLTDLVGLLREEHDRLDALQVGDIAVRAAFNLSSRQLDETEAFVFDCLGLFRSGRCDAAAMSAVCGFDAWVALERLVDLALVESLAAARYAVHDLMRIFAAERLAGEAASHHDARTRLVAYLTLQASERAPELQPFEESASSKEALSWFDEEWPTILGVFDDVFDGQRHEELDELADAVAPFVVRRRRWTEWQTILRAMLVSAAHADDDWSKGRAHHNLGIALLEVGAIADADEQFTAALELARGRGDVIAEARSLAQLGSSAKRAGGAATATRLLRKAAARYADGGDELGGARALGDLGNALEDLGDLAGAIDAHRSALAAFGRLGNLHGQALEQGNLGMALARSHDFEGAAAAAGASVELFDRLDDRVMAAKARLECSGYLLALGQHEASADAAEAARAGYEAIGDRVAESVALARRARALARQQHNDEARHGFEAALALLSELNAPAEEAMTLAEFAELRRDLEDPVGASGLLVRASLLSDSVELSLLHVQVTQFQAELDEQNGDCAAAERRLLDEADAAEARDDQQGASIALMASAEQHRRWGEPDRWHELNERARSLGGEPDDAAAAVVVNATGASEESKRRIATAIVGAVDALETAFEEIEVVLGEPDAPPGETRDWMSTPDGLVVRPWLLELPDAAAHVRLHATVHGAVVVHLLGRAGVDASTPLGETLHAIAESWAIQRRFIVGGPLPEDLPLLPRLARAPSGDDIARVLGAALAGNALASQRLTEWRAVASDDDAELTASLLEALSPAAGPAEFLTTVADIYNAVSGRGSSTSSPT